MEHWLVIKKSATYVNKKTENDFFLFGSVIFQFNSLLTALFGAVPIFWEAPKSESFYQSMM